jgi:GrpB-like predicted nucleotidyltransferase (UPF0157 family)
MVEIVPYQENWPSEFQVIAASLRRALGELALRIDHIGSTSVPGLSAKDVIDIQVTVAALDDRVRLAMATLGYTLLEGRRDHGPPHVVGPETEWDKLLFLPPAGQRRTHTHVRVQGRANQRYALLFRDYLRAHPATAEAYAELKRRLAQYLAEPQTYPEVKDPAVDLIYLAAEEWAAATNWRGRRMRKGDVITGRAIRNPYFRAEVERTAQVIYETHKVVLLGRIVFFSTVMLVLTRPVSSTPGIPAKWIVNTMVDPGAPTCAVSCSLRSAVNIAAPDDIIVFDASVFSVSQAIS